MITTLHIEISSACSLKHWKYMCSSYSYFKGWSFNEFIREYDSDYWFRKIVTTLVFGHRRPQLGEVH